VDQGNQLIPHLRHQVSPLPSTQETKQSPGFRSTLNRKKQRRNAGNYEGRKNTPMTKPFDAKSKQTKNQNIRTKKNWILPRGRNRFERAALRKSCNTRGIFHSFNLLKSPVNSFI